jgi:hypothetical protein
MPEPTDTTGSTTYLVVGERVRIITGSVGRYYGATGTVLGLCTERHHHLARVHLDGTDEPVYVWHHCLERESATAGAERSAA